MAGAVVLAAGGAKNDEATAEPVGSTSTATTPITRRDLVEVQTEDGTLGYADTRSVAVRVSGTVTWLPAIGRIVRPDEALYKVDESPVILMDGRVPAYRPLGPGVSAGADIRQLEQSLRAEGYDPSHDILVDGSWDVSTGTAVRRWQQAHGLTQSGEIELGRIVFLPGPRRVASSDATLGVPGAGPPNQGAPVPALTTTSTRRLVTVDLDTTKAALAKRGDRVGVVLPSGRRTGGRISSVGRVARQKPDQEPSSASSTPTATIEVKIRLLVARTGLDQAPVSVRFERSRRKDVLAIPVTALLAQAGGKFAVQLVGPAGAHRVVAVEAGLYTSGFVEIRGAGLQAGQRVTDAAIR